MDLLDLLKSAGGGDSVGQLANAVGLGSDDTSKLVAALAPALMGGLAKNARHSGGRSKLESALKNGGHDRYINDPSSMLSDATRRDGNKILGHLLGSKDTSRKVAASAASDTGIDPALIKKALPLLATLAMGAMAKKQAAPESGGLGDLIGMARKFF
jgi:hypothetical protein